MPKKKYEQVIFEEPLIDISMEPTEEEDPLFIDPTAESINIDVDDDLVLNGFSIFSPKLSGNKVKKDFTSIQEKDELKIKEEVVEGEGVKVKEEPKDPDDFDLELPKEEEIDPVEALAQALDKVEYLCPKCTYRSTDKQEVTQHFVSSHRVFQIGVPRPCDKCDFVAKTVRELAAHKKASHPRTFVQDNLPTLPTGEYKCPHCDFTSHHRNNIRSHMKVHTQDTVYTCDKCPYTAISRLNIENHAARHLVKSRKKWKFKCKHCGLLERTEKLLQRHLILHGEGEMVKCQLCPYKSPYNHIISMHTRICHGIIGKRTWDKEEKWKMSVRKSTRKCARKRSSYAEDQEFDEEFQEEFLELPVRKSNRGRKKRANEGEKGLEIENVKTGQEEREEEDEKSQENNGNESSLEKKAEDTNDMPRRLTLEERLGRARELINRNLSKKKMNENNEVEESKKELENQDKDKSGEVGNVRSDVENASGSEEENESDANSENHSDEEETGSKEDEWSEEESEFSAEIAEESMQSFASDKGILDSTHNSLLRDNENSMTDSESLSRAESGDGKTEPQTVRKRKHTPETSKQARESRSKSDNEKESPDYDESAKRLKIDSSLDEPIKINMEETIAEEKDENPLSDKSEKVPDKISDCSDNDEQTEESMPAVLVLKRNGSSFTCVQKNNSDSS